MDTTDAVPYKFDELVQPHVASFDYLLEDGLQQIVEDLEPIEIQHPVTKQTHRFWFEDAVVGKPAKDDVSAMMTDARLYPRDCREAGTTYKAVLDITLCCQAPDSAIRRIPKRLGALPIMVKSKNCFLRHRNRSQLVALKEEANEMGGFFVCNGIERIIRLLIMQRRHYIMGLRRGAYHKRGPNYTDCATLVRCVRRDQSSATVRCHYLTDGTVNFAFTMRRAEYFIPVGILLKCFLEVSDRELYDKVMAGAPTGTGHAAFVAERAQLMLQQPHKLGLYTRVQCLEYLGQHFRVALDMHAGASDYQVGEQLLRNYVFIHLQHSVDKLLLLITMLNKLYALVNSLCCEDNPDALTHHEMLLPGHLLLKFMKEKLEDCLGAFKEQVNKDLDKSPGSVNLQDEAYLRKASERMPDVGRKVEYMLNTGNLVTKSGLDLSQASGFTVIAEKLNFFRYISHFRSVHRGAYFAELRTTTVRKLLPESWGFMCPVHTPDGAPCGLLNHMTAACRVVTEGPDDPEETEAAVMQVLAALGMVPAVPLLTPPPLPAALTVMLDGKVAGHVPATRAAPLVDRLRAVKAAVLAMQLGGDAEADAPTAELSRQEALVPAHMEVAYIPYEQGGPYPGIFLFTQSARMVRPVRQLASNSLELIGTLEQLHLNIRCPDGGVGGSPGLRFTHEETHAGAMLSVVASVTPYSDYNQSPRNMYQCQMAKQTMGTPTQAYGHRTDNKMYRLLFPQTPMCRTGTYDAYHMDEYPNGTNAVVAVLAYTGYDMEDAMILNKSSMERGFGHAHLYKTEMIDLKEEKRGAKFAAEPLRAATAAAPRERPVGAFGQKFPQNVPSAATSTACKTLGVVPEPAVQHGDRVDVDGLPHVGAVVWPGQDYHTEQTEAGAYKHHGLKGEEVAIVDQVTLIGSGGSDRRPQRANIKLRINRNPVIGDKFSSRHGQKGVLSVLWPDTDMPYCERTGMRPDLIINPHAFPSRMTIGMLVESLASKAAALQGKFVDASPFQRCDGKPGNPVELFGQYLEAAGYARHGQETMISGVSGEQMPCDIYIGPVYYQRLRHMVSDKFQVRSTGPINPLTRQPVKGRKKGGGIRFGEMERDSLLAHGAAYLLHDRLHTCSDYHVLDVCTRCGSLLAPLQRPFEASTLVAQHHRAGIAGPDGSGRAVCPMCNDGGAHVGRVAMPYVFKYLATELAAMNIKVVVDVQ